MFIINEPNYPLMTANQTADVEPTGKNKLWDPDLGGARLKSTVLVLRVLLSKAEHANHANQ